MTVTATNLIQGPATMYVAPFGTVEPTAFAAPGVGWVDVGGTKDGISLEIESSFSVLTVDQIVDEVARTRTERKTSVKTSLAEATLENLARALAEKAPVGGVIEPALDGKAFLPDYLAVLFDGIAPGGKVRRVIIRKALGVDSTEVAYKKDDQTIIPATFAAHYVTASIAPWKITDQP